MQIYKKNLDLQVFDQTSEIETIQIDKPEGLGGVLTFYIRTVLNSKLIMVNCKYFTTLNLVK